MTPTDPTSGKMTINLPNVIRTLGEYLYSDPNVAVRELLQNAHDTCVVAQASGVQSQPAIHVHTDAVERILVFQDNGAGMTEEEVRKFLTVIGSSRTDEVRKQLEDLGQRDVADRLIGRFGIGLLAAFIIGNRVEFRSRSRTPGSPVILWECDGGPEYRISTIDKTDFPFGTEVVLHVSPEYLGVLNTAEIEQLIHRYADLLRVPIYLDNNPRPVNVMNAPWDESATPEQYREFLQSRFPDDGILDVIPLDINEDGGATRVKGALFVPEQEQFIVREHGDLTIYCHRYFVCDDERKLLPQWARFVRGIIDTPTLREMASREAVLHDENFERVQIALGRTILSYLTDRHKTAPKLFRDIVATHNTVMKAWAIESDELFDHIKNVVLFRTDDGLLSLPEYFQRSASAFVDDTDSTRRIFFFTTRGGAVQQSMLFKAKGLPVIDASGFPDAEFLTKYAATTPGVEVHRLDASALGFIFDPLPSKDRKWRELEAAYRDLNVNAEVVSFLPESIPAVLFQHESQDLTEAKDLLQDPSLSPTIKNLLRRAIEQQQRSAADPSAETLYLNASNVIIRTLAQVDLRQSEAMEVVRAVYYNASLFSAQAGRPLPAKRAKQVFEGNNRTLASLMNKIHEVDALKSQLQAMKPKGEGTAVSEPQRERENEHIQCFLACPFRPEYDIVLEALRSVVEDAPYFWEVARADRKFFERTVPDNVGEWMKRAQCYAVELSECNPNVMMELGQMYWGYPNRPIFLLQRQGSKPDIVDLGARIRIEYPWGNPPDREAIAGALRTELEKSKELLPSSASRHFFSAYAMRDLKWVEKEMKVQVARRYTTIEEFLSKDPATVADDLRAYGVPSELVKAMQDEVRRRLRGTLVTAG